MRLIWLLIGLLTLVQPVLAADVKITELPAATAVTSDDLAVIVDAPGGSAATKKITISNFFCGGTAIAQGHVFYYDGTNIKCLGVGTAGNPLTTGGAAANPSWFGLVLARGTNTFSLTNGTASLDIAAGATLDINTSLTVNTGAVTLVGQAGGSNVTLPSTGTLLTAALPATLSNAAALTWTVVDDNANALKIGATGKDDMLKFNTLNGAEIVSINANMNLFGYLQFGAASYFEMGANPADAGTIRLSNTQSIQWESDPEGTDVNALSVDASEVVQIAASGASGVVITPATTITGVLTTGGNVELGHANDTTISRVSAGVIAVEGVTVTRTIASGTSAMNTSSISSGACATVVTTAATNTATTDIIGWGFNTDPTAITGFGASASGGLFIYAYPTANNVNFKVCNNTAGAITPGAMTLNWKVVR